MSRRLGSALLIGSLLLLVACGDAAPSDGGSDASTANVDDAGGIGGDIGGEDTDQGSDTGGTGSDGETGDGGSVDIGGGDTGGGDTGGGDTGDTAGGEDTSGGPLCPGGEGCPCDQPSDCDNNICIDTADGKKCAKKCAETCPKGFTCKSYGETDPVFVCVEDHVAICSPCEKHTDCNAMNPGTLCVDYGDIGKFCGGVCKVDSDCPDTYACVDTPNKDTGAVVKQCRLKKVAKGGSGGACTDDGQCPKGESCADGKCAVLEQPMCPCSKWATVFAASTSCSTSNAFGTCKGTRACTDKGMSPCSAATPAEETCNAIDDDCDGVTDVLPASVTCTVASFIDEGTKTKCASDKDCPAKGEGCDPSDGQCKTLVGACPGKAKCGAKGALLCVDAKKAQVESCNGDDDDCDGAVDEDFTWSEPGSDVKKAIGTSCGQGACAGGKVLCESLISAACTTAKAAGAEKCNNVDDDCDGKTDDDACADGDECTQDVCDGKSGTCTNPPGATCDDKNQCTKDSCDTKSGKCVFTFYDGSCDDGDACTVGDKCVDQGGTATCEKGATAKECDDNNVCTDDSCDKDKGCLNLPNAVTQSCFDGDQQLIGVGTCKAGVRFCKEGKLLATCEGQSIPAKAEACDTLDNDCDGSTDEGCAATGAHVGTSTVSATTAGKKMQVYLHIGGESASGRATGKKHGVWSGFVSWLVGALGK